MQRLLTKEGRNLPQIPWENYPRPQLRRAEWLCLNGAWELKIGERKETEQIRVPFCPESLLSGIQIPPRPGEKMVYRRSFSIPDSWTGKRILLHFGAVGRKTEILINGRKSGEHDNGYLGFSLDITDALQKGENELAVCAVNDLSPQYPWGKQKEKRGGMWYTPCSGIWQTVWMEPVPETYIRSLKIRNGADWAEIEAEGVREGRVELAGESWPLRDGKVRITVPDPECWSPDNPRLYPFTLYAGEDRVESYFALRTLSVRTVNGIPRLCLNGKAYFFNGLLDQGYWSDGLYTPAEPEAYERDILAAKELGFNTLRKHIKIEAEQFYYDCDRLGMIVFQDMVNNGEYRFLRDTALPTLNLLRRRDSRLNPDPETRQNFLKAMEKTVEQLGNHPCICLWTVFNEGWGQFCADEAYRRLKMLDSSRFIDSTSGWFHQKESDVDSLHIYFRELHLGKEKRPQLLSEFGGYVWKIPEHSFNTEKTYGYRIFRDRDSYVRALQALYRELRPLASQGLCGAVYTQISDVEDETNGILTFDRAIRKLQPEEMKDLAEKLQKAVNGEPGQ